jgi:hypothetical protein
MRIPRSVRATIGGAVAAVLATTVVTVAAEPPPTAVGAIAEWSRLEAEIAQVLLRVDEPLPAAPPAVGRPGPGGLADRIDAVLAGFALRRRLPAAAAERAHSPAPPDAFLRALRRVADSLRRAERVAGTAVGSLPDDALRAQVFELRRLAAKHHGARAAAAGAVAASDAVSAAHRAIGAPLAENDDCTAAAPLVGGSQTGTTLGATSAGAASCGLSAAAADVWFVYTAADESTIAFETSGASFDTVLSLHSGCPGTTFNELACSDDADGLRSRLSAPLAAGQRVWVRVSGYAGEAGSFQLAASSSFAISGTVTDSSTAAPIADVDVDVFDAGGFFVDSTATGADGGYVTANLPSGDHFVRTRSTDHQDELYDDLPCIGGCVAFQGTPIPVGTGTTAGIDFALDLGGSISGTVTDGEHPLQNVAVQVLTSAGFLLEAGFSGADGSYRVGGLEPGTYFVRTASVSHVNELYDDLPCIFQCDHTVGTPVSVTAGAETTGIDFSLDAGGTISGAVSDEATGDPLGAILLEVYDETGELLLVRFTAQDGTYSRGGLPGGTYYVLTATDTHTNELYDDLPCHTGCDVLTGTPVPVTPGLTTAGIDFALAAFTPIAGTVRSAATGTPLANVRVTAYDELARPVASLLSAGNGSYLLPDLPAEGLRLKAGPSASHAAQLLAGLPFGLDVLGSPEVEDPATTDLDFALWPLGACGFPATLALADEAIATAAELSACGDVTLGPGLEIASGGRLEARAGGTVRLADGFRVASGGRLAVASGSALPPPVGDVLYAEDFDDGFALGWDNSGGASDLWRLDSGCPATPLGRRTLSFSRSSPDCDYDMVVIVAGWARSPLLDLSSATGPTLEIEHRWGTEGSGFFDAMSVEASGDGGATWTSIWTTTTSSSGGYVTETLDLTPYATSSFRFRFVFDSVDNILNDFPGWSIDRVRITTD